MITLEDVKKNEEAKELIVGSQKQLDSLRIHRAFNKTCKHCIKQGR